MTWTPRRHLESDLDRVDALFAEGEQIADDGVRGDVYRHCVAIAVGAMDAYLCDAYAHLLVSTIRAFNDGKITRLPKAYANESLPVGPLLGKNYTHRQQWALRMAVRQRMEKDNMLRVSRARTAFNPALPTGQKLWGDIIFDYARLRRKRLTKWTANEIHAASGSARDKMKKAAWGRLTRRIGNIVQRRHDIVHNCDRPKQAPQRMSRGTAKAMIADVRDFVIILDNHLTKHRIA